ncbi:MAG: hypothetical protein M3458_21980 [Acidobacteriota bacterium]|nr:hypothetical protein [Acidobacteriota bacterium]
MAGATKVFCEVAELCTNLNEESLALRQIEVTSAQQVTVRAASRKAGLQQHDSLWSRDVREA